MPVMRLGHYTLLLICQFKCGLRSHKLCLVCLTGEKKVLKITPCSPEFTGQGGETVNIYYIFLVAIFRMFLCWSFSKLEVISGVFFYIFSLCSLLSFSCLLSNIILLDFRCLLHFSSPFYKNHTHLGIPLVFDDLADRTEHAEWDETHQDHQVQQKHPKKITKCA